MTGILEKKIALVTGGGSGIGRATCIALANEGASVAVADLNPETGNITLDHLKNMGAKALYIESDVSSANSVKEMINITIQKLGGLDCAVNNAGIQGELTSTSDCSEENWNNIISVNLTGVWLCMKHEIIHMLKYKSGTIVNVASSFGMVGSPNMPAYSASKHGVLGLTKTAALECAQAGIRINAVCPGTVKTPLVDNLLKEQPDLMESIIQRLPMKRLGKPEEIGSSIAWLCSDKSTFATGMVMPIDGGLTTQ